MLKIIEWLANGATGASSKTMAFIALGVKPEYCHFPADPSDLNRCLLLLEAEPMVRLSFPKLRELSPQWAAIIDHWDELERMFLDEAGLVRDPFLLHTPKTYDFMCKILGEPS